MMMLSKLEGTPNAKLVEISNLSNVKQSVIPIIPYKLINICAIVIKVEKCH